MSKLGAIQREIDATGRMTLSPDRAQATPLLELVETVALPGERASVETALGNIALSQLRAFPENLLWDLDYVTQELCEHARAAADFTGFVDEFTKLTVKLMELYGTRSPIRFRYVHDFLYGFDWARWVRRDPRARSAVKPFCLTYLGYSRTRAYELFAMIAKNHDRYPTLPPNETRNPFAFSREPDAELQLYRDLAARDAIPIRAWDRAAKPVWNAPHDETRAARAAELGLKRSA